MHFSVQSLLFLTAAVAAARVPVVRDHKSLRVRQDPEGPVDPSTTKYCTWYFQSLDASEDCTYIEDYWGITHANFVLWNPSVKDDCSGIKVGNSYCVDANIPTTTSSTGPTGSPAPSPTQPGTIASCDQWYLVVKGDTCDTVSQKFGITFAQLREWNPYVDENCGGFWAQYWYCVSIPGIDPPPTGTITSTAGPTGPTPPSATQPGIVAGCQQWYGAVAGDTCDKITKSWSITIDQLVAWNPAIGSGCSNGLWAGYSYCIGITGQLATTKSSGPTTTPTACAVAHPTPTQPGSICNCKKWHPAVSGDTCWKLEQTYKISEAQFTKWNPESGCNFWAGYSVCVSGP